MGRLICGDAREVLAEMPEQSIHACITSPPYWGLRDYGCPEVMFGGDAECRHEWGPEIPGDARGGSGPNAKEAYAEGGETTYARQVARGNICRLCGAWRGQFGLEPTPEMYVEHTLEFLRAIRRVLRDDGTCWWVIGDTYSGGIAEPTRHKPSPGVMKGICR
jgi:site-specific DNA-methyltransferase (adenine-specific)